MSESQMLRTQLEALRLSELSNELNTVKTLLRKTQEEFSDLKEQSKIDKEHLIERGKEADKLKTKLEGYSIGASEENNQLELCKSELRRQAEALDKLNEMEGELKVHRITIRHKLNLIHINFSCSHSLRA